MGLPSFRRGSSLGWRPGEVVRIRSGFGLPWVRRKLAANQEVPMRIHLSLMLFCCCLLVRSASALADDEIGKDPALLKLIAGTSGLSASSFYEGFTSEKCEAGPGRLAT